MKYNEGQYVSKDDNMAYIVCKSDLKSRWKPIALAGVLITTGLGVIIRTVWVDGCNAFERAQANALHKIGVFTDINVIDTETFIAENEPYQRNY